MVCLAISDLDVESEKTALKNLIQKLVKLAAPHKLELSGQRALSSDWDPVDLKEKLGIALSQKYANWSLALVEQRNRKYLLSGGFVVVGLVGAAMMFLLASLQFSIFFSASRIEARLGHSSFLLSLAILSLVFLLGLALAGLIIRRKLDQELFDPLQSNGRHIFETEKMDEKWRFFKSWFHSEVPQLGVKQKDGSIWVITPELCDFDLLEVFVLGETRHRDKLIGDASVNMSPLVIPSNDWTSFERIWQTRLFSERAAATSGVKSIVPQTSSSQESDGELSLRQQLKGEKTNWSPRFILMVDKQEFFKRYANKPLVVSHLSKRDKRYHLALMALGDNFKLLISFFDQSQVMSSKGDAVVALYEELRILLEDRRYPTRLTELMSKSWDALETYIERTEIITDQELKQFYPELAKL